MQKEITYREARVVYDDIGTGNPVVLIHGFAEDSKVWDNQVKALKTKCRLLVPDLPGSGRSLKGNNSWSMEEMAELIKALLLKENIEQPVIIGHSMGGYITLAFIEKYPDFTTAFGLFHSSAFADSEEKKTARQKNIDFIGKNGSLEFLKQAIPNLFGELFKQKQPDFINNFINAYKDFDPDALMDYTKSMMIRPDRTEVLKTYKKPVLFIAGKHDNAVPFEQTMQQVHLPQLSYIHILENAGHMGMIEEPQKSIDYLQEFITAAFK